MTKQIYSGYRINVQANQLGIPAIPQTIKGASGDIVQSLREGPVNFAIDELNRLLINNGSGGGGGSISIALASIAIESILTPGTWILTANTTIAVGTTLTIASGITFVIPGNPNSLTLTVNGTLQVSNGGTITTLGTLINNSNQTVQVDEFALFTIDGGTCTNNGTFTNDGRLDVSNEGSLEVAQGSILTNEGNIYVVGANCSITVATGSTIQNGGLLLIGSDANMEVAAGSTVQNTGKFNVSGAVQIQAGSTFINTGNVNASGGTLITGANNITGGGNFDDMAIIDTPPVCGDQTFTSPLAQDKTVEVCQSFIVDPNTTFTIPAGFTLTNNGIMTVCGTLVVNGAFVNNAYVNFDLSGAICNIYKDSQDASGNFINNGTCINNGSIYIYDNGTLENNGNLMNMSVIKYGNGSGSCGTGNFIGPYQGVPPTVGCYGTTPEPLEPLTFTSDSPPAFPYTIPASYTLLTFTLIGAGGGGNDGYTTAGGGGGGGAYIQASFTFSGGTLEFSKGIGGSSATYGSNGTATFLTYNNGELVVSAGGGEGGGDPDGSQFTGGASGIVTGNDNPAITVTQAAPGNPGGGVIVNTFTDNDNNVTYEYAAGAGGNSGNNSDGTVTYGLGGNGGHNGGGVTPGNNGYWEFTLSAPATGYV
jgi:hypothetical protein